MGGHGEEGDSLRNALAVEQGPGLKPAAPRAGRVQPIDLRLARPDIPRESRQWGKEKVQRPNGSLLDGVLESGHALLTLALLMS